MSEKKKKDSFEPMRPLPFIGLWIVAYIVGWIATMFLRSYFLDSGWLLQSSPVWLFIIISTSIPGVIISALQVPLIRRGFGIRIRYWWLASTVAWGAGGLLWLLLLTYAPREILLALGENARTFVNVLVVIPPAIAQAYLLRKYVKSAAMWALAMVVGAILFTLSLEVIRPGFMNGLLIWSIAGALEGSLTGMALYWLFHTKPDESDHHHEIPDRLQNKNKRENELIIEVDNPLNEFRQHEHE